jgi:hypothetical protein
MCRKWTIIVAVALLFAGCAQYENIRPALSVLVGPDTDNPENPYVVRLGAEVDQVEFGGQFEYLGRDGKQSTGVYAVAYLPIDPNVVGQTYLGAVASLSMDADGGYAGPIVGTIHQITDQVAIIAEGGWREFSGDYGDQFGEWSDQWTAKLGVRIRY